MKIVAIGGGQNGRVKTFPDGSEIKYPLDNIPINKKILELSGKKNPTILFIPTAGRDNLAYTDYLKPHFQNLGATILGDLLLVENAPSESEMRKILDKTDIIYVTGGDTLLMMNVWAKTGFDKLLKEYGDRGVVLSGLSAGAICWFDYYDNDEYIRTENNEIIWDKLDVLPGLGFIKGFAIPHYDANNNKQKYTNMISKKGLIGYALDNNAAMVFDNGKISIIPSQPDRSVYYLNMPQNAHTKTM